MLILLEYIDISKNNDKIVNVLMFIALTIFDFKEGNRLPTDNIKPDTKRTAELLRRNDRMHRRIFEREVAEAFGIHRSQHMMLMFMSHNVEISQRQIAEHFDISASAVAVTLKKLECGGFILRTTDGDDGRKNNIILTENGKNVIDKTRLLFSSIDSAMFEGLDGGEMEVLLHCLEKINGNLRKIEEKQLQIPKGVIE